MIRATIVNNKFPVKVGEKSELVTLILEQLSNYKIIPIMPSLDNLGMAQLTKEHLLLINKYLNNNLRKIEQWKQKFIITYPEGYKDGFTLPLGLKPVGYTYPSLINKSSNIIPLCNDDLQLRLISFLGVIRLAQALKSSSTANSETGISVNLNNFLRFTAVEIFNKAKLRQSRELELIRNRYYVKRIIDDSKLYCKKYINRSKTFTSLSNLSSVKLNKFAAMTDNEIRQYLIPPMIDKVKSYIGVNRYINEIEKEITHRTNIFNNKKFSRNYESTFHEVISIALSKLNSNDVSSWSLAKLKALIEITRMTNTMLSPFSLADSKLFYNSAKILPSQIQNSSSLSFIYKDFLIFSTLLDETNEQLITNNFIFHHTMVDGETRDLINAWNNNMLSLEVSRNYLINFLSNDDYKSKLDYLTPPAILATMNKNAMYNKLPNAAVSGIKYSEITKFNQLFSSKKRQIDVAVTSKPQNGIIYNKPSKRIDVTAANFKNPKYIFTKHVNLIDSFNKLEQLLNDNNMSLAKQGFKTFDNMDTRAKANLSASYLANIKSLYNSSNIIGMFNYFINTVNNLTWLVETKALFDKTYEYINSYPDKKSSYLVRLYNTDNSTNDPMVNINEAFFQVKFTQLIEKINNSTYENNVSSYKKIFDCAKRKNIFPADAIKELEKSNPFEFIFNQDIAEEFLVLLLAYKYKFKYSYMACQYYIKSISTIDPSGENTYQFFNMIFKSNFTRNSLINPSPFIMYFSKLHNAYNENQKIKTSVLNDQVQYITDVIASAYKQDTGKTLDTTTINLGGWFSFIPIIGGITDTIGDALEATRDATIFIVKKTIQNTIGSALSKSILPEKLYSSLNDMSAAGLEIVKGNISTKVLISFVENAIQAGLQPVALASHYVREIKDEALKIHIISQLDKYSGGSLSMVGDLAATADQLNQNEDIDWEKKLIEGVVVGISIASAGSASALGTGLAVSTGSNIATKKTFLGKTALGKLVIKGTADVISGKALSNALTDAIKLQASTQATKTLVKSGLLGVGAASAAVRSGMDYYINDKSGSEIVKQEAKKATTDNLVRNFATSPTQAMAIGFISDRSFDEGSKYLKTDKKTITNYKKDQFGTIVLDPNTGSPIIESTSIIEIPREYDYDGIAKDAKIIATKVSKYHIDKKLSKYGITTDQVISAVDKVGQINEVGSINLSEEADRIKNQVARKYEAEYNNAIRRAKNAKSELEKFDANKELSALNEKSAKEINRLQNTLNKEWESTKDNYNKFDFSKELGEEWGSIKNDPTARLKWLNDKYGDKFLMWLIQKYGPKYSYNPTAQDYIQFQDWRPATSTKKSIVGKLLLGLIAGSVTYTIFG